MCFIAEAVFVIQRNPLGAALPPPSARATVVVLSFEECAYHKLIGTVASASRGVPARLHQDELRWSHFMYVDKSCE